MCVLYMYIYICDTCIHMYIHMYMYWCTCWRNLARSVREVTHDNAGCGTHFEIQVKTNLNICENISRSCDTRAQE